MDEQEVSPTRKTLVPWCVCGHNPQQHATDKCGVDYCSCHGYREAKSSKDARRPQISD